MIGTGNGENCPVAAVLSCMVLRGPRSAAVLSYMVLRGPAPGPLFLFSDGSSLTSARFVAVIWSALLQAGIDAKSYSGHSFRIGAATTATLCEIPDSLIKVLGVWQSSAYQLYIRTPSEVLRGVTRQLL